MEQPPLVCTEETTLRGCNTLIDVERYRRIDLSIEIVDGLNRCIDTVRLVPLQRNNSHMGKREFFRFKDENLFLSITALDAMRPWCTCLIHSGHISLLSGGQQDDPTLPRLAKKIQLFFASIIREFHDNGCKHRPSI